MAGDIRVERIRYIDFLKFIGLTAIILAHVGAPDLVVMARSFDVPFMVILSGILGERAFQRHVDKGGFSSSWCLKRFRRLVIPTWIFLTIYFLILFLVQGSAYEMQYYIDSYCLTRYGVGCVWIILIYMYNALWMPVFHKMKLSKIGLPVILLLYGLFEVLYYYRIGLDNRIFDSTFNYIVPYGLMTYLGYHYFQMKRKYKYLIVAISAAIFCGLALYYWKIYGYPQFVQIAKYPPRLYFLAYGVAASFILLLICESISMKIYESKICRFVSENSLWIYLWHMLFLELYKMLMLPEVWYLKWIVICVVSTLFTYLVNKCLRGIKVHLLPKISGKMSQPEV